MNSVCRCGAWLFQHLCSFVNKPLEGINFPASPPRFAVGYEFNQALLGLTFPVSLQMSMF
jgi:hypothetical protein